MKKLVSLLISLTFGHRRPKTQLWELKRKLWLIQNRIPVFIVYDRQRNFLVRKSTEIIEHVQGRQIYLPWIR